MVTGKSERKKSNILKQLNAFVATTVKSCPKFIITELADKIFIVEPIHPEFVIWDQEQSQACLKIHLRCCEIDIKLFIAFRVNLNGGIH